MATQEQIEAAITAGVHQVRRTISSSSSRRPSFRRSKACRLRRKPLAARWLQAGATGSLRSSTPVPHNFDGSTNWKVWSVVLRRYAGACLPQLGPLLKRSEKSATPMLNATLQQDERSCSVQVYYMLMMLCKSAALTTVVNAGSQEDLEAWRLLVETHEPSSLTRSAGLVQELPSFSFERDIAAGIAQYDRDVGRYEKSSNEVVPQNIRIGVSLRMMPEGALKQNFVMNSSRLTTWNFMKFEFENVRRAQGAASNSPQPTDISKVGQTLENNPRKGKSRG